MARITQHHIKDRGINQPAMIGIHTGGVWIAQRLHQLMKIEVPIGQLDISFYRDDFTRIGMNPQVKPSQIPFAVEDRHIILVDDVIQSGRTIRAAMNEIFDFGRPASITLVTLIERNGRELPIQPDIIGLDPPLATDEHIRLRGPNPLILEISGAPGNRNSI
ncbi:MAG TPA: bifunctional pyr operon transcriptional regulator/uracil phosphoribosyltransferase PyrR [Thiolapillus brandeum]|uniref:Bifunctional pyr operon transcriptional regulator/uracil phosphoribosyltransferase PyrR n=1 Tax=Thiolapillus brandeum TaxID=1076588 RepID=A0A831NTX7_9GAMM|nr:bifunctional pyr operon transcriptional regulator/uracil phosphoribosyltransferase PyrR [Thiolapillus brandeum]